MELDTTFILDAQDINDLLHCGSPGAIRVLNKHGHHFARDSFGALYYFSGGRYVPDGDEIASYLGIELFGTMLAGRENIKWTRHRDRDLLRALAINCPPLLITPPDARYISLRNGVFDLEKRQIVCTVPKPHQWLWPIQLPITFDPTAKCYHWPAFIKEVFTPDALELAWQIPCWLMLPGMSSQQVSLVFTGEGSNGKSVCLEAYTRFLGANNVEHFSIHDLQHNRFSSRYLLYKLVNICPELPARKFETEFFKTVVGEGSIMGELKGGAIKKMTPFCKILCSTNSIVRSHDDTFALYRRLLPIDFVNQFEVIPGKREQILSNLCSGRELAGMFNHCVEVYSLLARKGLEVPNSSREINQSYQEMNSPVWEWANEFLVFEQAASESSTKLYEHYVNWRRHQDQWRRYGAVDKNIVWFVRDLKRLFPKEIGSGKTPEGNLCTGVRIKWIGESPVSNSRLIM